MRDFHQKSLKQIKLWAWAASVLPVVGIVALILIKIFGTDDIYSVIVISGGTIIFAISVVWWWWVMYTIAKISQDTANTADNIGQVVTEVKSLRKELKE